MFKRLHYTYLRFITTVIISTFLLMLLTVFYIINSTFSNNNEYEKAFIWQEKYKGVVGLTDAAANNYKQNMTDWTIAEKNIDILAIGSSTMMSITSDMFPNNIMFNGSKNSNPLSDSISKAKYYANSSKKIKYIIIGFDWSIGKVYGEYHNQNYTIMSDTKLKISLYDKIKDAMSYQRASIVIANIYNNIFNNDIVYRCPTEDTIGTDIFFNTDAPNRCHGFRVDGSATFENNQQLTYIAQQNYLKNGLNSYKDYLAKSFGEFDSRYLVDLKEIDKMLKDKGGKLVILIPPLMPNATSLIEQSNEGIYLKNTIDKLMKFSTENNIYLINASKSENYNCNFNDFMDVHHAFPSCYKKVFDKLNIK